jgi:hypothetical protein
MRTPRLAPIALGSLLAACAPAPFHPAASANAAGGSPLGPSYVLVPLPSDDDAILGRVLLAPLEDGRSLDEVSRPNECAAKLAPKRLGPAASTFEDAEELAAGAKARAALGAFGFEGDAQLATHFYYRLDIDKKVSQLDTPEYTACCKEKGTCGYGYVSALVYGAGQYATASESSAEGGVSIPVAGGAGGFVKAKVLHRRSVRGWVAALVTVTDPGRSKAIGVLGDAAAVGVTLNEQTLPEQVRARFELEKIETVPAPNVWPRELAYAFRDGNGQIVENEFVRRYVALTGAHEIDGAKRHRNSALLIGGGVTVAASLPFLIYGLTHLSRHCELSDYYADSYDPVSGHTTAGGACGQSTIQFDPNATTTNGLGVAFAAGGGVAALTGGILMLVASTGSDGVPSDHSLSKLDADLYVAKYNRALLRQTVKDTESKMRALSSDASPPVRITPIASPGFVGLSGSF